MSILWHIVLVILVCTGFFCAGFVWCHEYYVQNRIKEIFERGYRLGIETRDGEIG